MEHRRGGGRGGIHGTCFRGLSITNSMEKNRSLQPDSSSYRTENFSMLRNPKVHYRVHNSPPLDPILSQFGPSYAPPRSARNSLPRSLFSILFLPHFVPLFLSPVLCLPFWDLISCDNCLSWTHVACLRPKRSPNTTAFSTSVHYFFRNYSRTLHNLKLITKCRGPCLQWCTKLANVN
jgi:hypothetical protein